VIDYTTLIGIGMAALWLMAMWSGSTLCAAVDDVEASTFRWSVKG